MAMKIHLANELPVTPLPDSMYITPEPDDRIIIHVIGKDGDIKRTPSVNDLSNSGVSKARLYFMASA